MKRLKPILVLALLLLESGLAWSGPQISLFNHNAGQPGDFFDIYGTGLQLQGANSVVFTGPIGTSATATTTQPVGMAESVGGTVYTWTYNAVYNVQVPNLSAGMYGVQVDAGGSYSNSVDFDILSYSGSDISPHGGFSMDTQLCNQCHTVHAAGSTYGLLNTASVTQVCEACHKVAGTGGSSAPAPNSAFGNETYATTSKYAVYLNTASGDAQHALASTLSSSVDSSVNLDFLNLNSQGFQSSQYNTAGNTGLGCDSCHTAHGNFGADLWNGWDAAQFSENYGYNVDGSVYNDPFAGYNQSFNLPSGAIPLSSALLLKNPSYQGGSGNSSTNPYIPVVDDWPTSRTFGQTIPGASDNNLSNFCMACHNLTQGGTGHNAHPLQAPAGSGPNDPQGSFASITDGCMACHGNPLTVASAAYGGYTLQYPTSISSDWDFPHSSPNANFLKVTNTTELCETCHYDQTAF